MKAIEKAYNELILLGYTITMYSNYNMMIETNDIKKATHLDFGWLNIGEGDYDYIGKIVKIPNRTINQTTEYFLKKLNTDVIYKNFSDEFNKILKAKGMNNYNSYPTSYGIGVFLLGSSNKIEDCKDQIESKLHELGVVFNTEYSNANFVFRFKISKSKDNIERLKQIALNN